MTELLLGNRFRVLGELGQGAMGAVYRVADTLDGDRELALKQLRVAGPITAELRLRFKEEFRAMGRLAHPNTIAVYGVGTLADGSPYLTMEVVAGQELAALARGPERVPLPRVYDWLMQLLQALGFIHARHYVHRDIKAQNIRVTPDGRLKLMDFGLMMRLGGTPRAHLLSGTPGYMPPEAITGGVVTGRSDLYAVGCLAYELLTGRLPFEGRTIDVLRDHVHTQPRPLQALVAGLPPALVRLVEKLLAKDPATRYQTAAEVMADLADLAGRCEDRENLAQQLSYLQADRLVGRERELAALERELAAARAGEGRAVFLGAPAGIGKSRLLQELLGQAQWHDMLALRGQCLAHGLEPLAPLAQATLPVLAVTTDAERQAFAPLLAGLFRERAFPEGRPAGLAPLGPVALGEQLVAWLGSVSVRTSVLLAIEDLHLADQPTLEALNAVIGRLEGRRVMVVATLRPDETPPGSAAWFTIQEQAARYVSLAPFDEGQVGQLVQALLGPLSAPADFSRLLYEATAGNALYLTEALRGLMEERALVVRDGRWQLPDDLARLRLPPNIEATLLRRLGQLSPAARALAAVAAVLGTYPTRAGLLAVSGLEEEALFLALDELVERQFLVLDEQRYAFPQALVRDALYGELSRDERKRLHQGVAEHLEAAGVDAPALAEIAHHFTRAENHQKAFAYQLRLGDQSQEAGLVPVAVKAWLQAIAHLEALGRPDQEALLARLRLDVGTLGFEMAPRAAIEALDLAFPYFEAEAARLGDAASFAALTQCLAALASAYGRNGEPAVALALADLLATLGHDDASPWGGVARVVRCAGLMPAGDFAAVVASAGHAERAFASHDLSGFPALIRASRLLARAYQNAGAFQGFQPRCPLPDDGDGPSLAGGDRNVLNELRSPMALWNAWTGREAAALAVLEEMTLTSRATGAPLHPTVLYLRPYLWWQRGDPERALAAVGQALRYPHVDQALVTKRLIAVLHGTLLADQGRWDAAESILRPIEAHAREAGLAFVQLHALVALGRTLVARGDRTAGRDALERAFSMGGEGPAYNPLHQALAQQALAEVDLADGAYAPAHARLSYALDIAMDPLQANVLLEAHLKVRLAVIYEAQGPRDTARTLLEEAGSLYEALGYRHFPRPYRAAADGFTASRQTVAPRLGAPWPFFLYRAGPARPGW